jgi:hypothetical protein
MAYYEGNIKACLWGSRVRRMCACARCETWRHEQAAKHRAKFKRRGSGDFTVTKT